ncbi:erythromycin esterase [Legionella sainthelensi]|uniref:Erythromycin esterase n=1 Tax=Legionella sainthelensi TaxID=28087 RepID=A0A0W0YCM6_9GAMM|nr:erythromycin esterase [Legionella sainthelensi]VEH28781.1 erythromycin esterase [Legionella sainthelensi]
MSEDALQKLLDELNHSAIPLEEQSEDYAAVIKQIGAARFVMIGEASHGSHEFYQARINVSQRLIKEHGFMAIAIEGDWPDVYRVHRYLQGDGNANQSECSLAAFKRFPPWM